MMEARPEGWELPVAQGLAEPVLLAGMPRDYAILMGTAALMLGLALRIWWLGLAWWTLGHALGWRESEVTAWKDALAPRGNQWRSHRSPGAAQEVAAKPHSPTLPATEGVDREPIPRQARNRARSSQGQIAFDF